MFSLVLPRRRQLWREVEALAPSLNEIGINMVWLPPAYKGASGGYSVGYDTYDLFDLGEFDQKGSVATKYGDKAQLLAAMKALKEHDIAVLLDVVVNHKMGADEKKPCRCSASMSTIAPRLPRRSLSVRHGLAIPFRCGPGSIRNLSGTTNALAVSTTLRIRRKTVCLKSSTITPVKAETSRSTMSLVTSTT